jgi:nucleotide-binding universal stress UspA family protein
MQTPQTPYRPSPLAEPKRILVATDLDDLEFLKPHAIAQAKAHGAHVTLLHAVPCSYLVPADPAAVPLVDRQRILDDSATILLGAARQMQSAGVACNVVCRPGDPLSLIEEELAGHAGSRVIMGTHGRGKLGRLTLGSIAHEVLSKLDVPVLVVGPHAHNLSHESPCKILHPVSLTGNYRESVQLAVELTHAWKAELTLLYVFTGDINEHGDAGRRIPWARTALSDLVPEDLYLDAKISTAVAFGNVAEQILHVANEDKVDWIVMGVNPHEQFWSLKEDAAYKGISGAHCPVLTLRHTVRARPADTVPTTEMSERSIQLLNNAGIF